MATSSGSHNRFLIIVFANSSFSGVGETGIETAYFGLSLSVGVDALLGELEEKYREI